LQQISERRPGARESRWGGPAVGLLWLFFQGVVPPFVNTAEACRTDQEKRKMAEIYVGKESEFGDRDRRIIAREGLEIGVFRIDDAFYAYENNCVHQGGPICQGKILGRVVEIIADDKTSRGLRFSDDDIHIVCPWHGYEYNLKTGRHPGDRNVRLKPYEVAVKDGDVYVVV
jgi:nitrite reductase/ring-hydroxylating ferredoxin subunit